MSVGSTTSPSEEELTLQEPPSIPAKVFQPSQAAFISFLEMSLYSIATLSESTVQLQYLVFLQEVNEIAKTATETNSDNFFIILKLFRF